MNLPAVNGIRFYDNHPAPADLHAEVLRGLRQRPRALPPKLFYDERGSQLFDAICDTPEYYLTRTETAILKENIEAIAARIGRGCLLVEPGSGNSMKVRLLLEALRPCAYMPMDISRDYLRLAAEEIAGEYRWLEVHAACTDYTVPLDLPYCPPEARRIAFFPGSSIGNFEPDQAVTFLANIARMVGPGGGLLIGVDRKKAPATLNAAYNDQQGITAAFNRNLLARINHELGADFTPDAYRHHAFYNEGRGRIEMHLVSTRPQKVAIGDQSFRFAAGDAIHTENSYKYGIEEFRQLATQAGFHPEVVWTDREDLFSIHYLVVPNPGALK